MYKNKESFHLLLGGVAAFCVYSSMYAFRKPFTSATFAGLKFLSLDFKVCLVISQTIGYTLSKFYGVRFIAELKPERRWLYILIFIGIAWIALLFFAIVPPPYNIIFLFINGFPLGVIYGLVFSYLEGRRSTEFLGALLTSSFIFASGFTQSVGKFLLIQMNISQWWMPFLAGTIFIIPLLFFTWLLNRIPPPTSFDKINRTERLPMNKLKRKEFLAKFRPGLIVLIITYVVLTIIRDYRSNFASDIWIELGYGNNSNVFTSSEIPAAIVTFILMTGLILIRKNILALMINHLVIIAGLLMSLIATILFLNNALSPYWWITTVGIGLYMAYVPFNCMLFDRLIAAFQFVGTAGFIIYIADSFGYLGSDVVLLTKNILHINISWSGFFIKMIIISSILGIVFIIISILYFRNKYETRLGIVPKLKYV